MRQADILRSKWIVAAVCASITGAAALCAAYSNCNPAAIMQGGPHRLINDLAVKRFVGTLSADDPRKAYAKAAGCDFLGPSFVERGEMMEAPPEQEQLFTWKEWVVEGGFTADEPELFNSFRHFYDPLSRNPDPPLTDVDLQAIDGSTVAIRGVPYLTDHLKQFELYLGCRGLLPSVATWRTNVKVNAKSWAVTGEPSAGGTENAYSWDKGREYFKQAFSGKLDGKPLSKAQRDKLHAKAWRSAGETMHLLADMTCVPHVRNDSHPGISLQRWIREKTIGIASQDQNRPEYSACLGILKHDPYELYCQDEMILRCVPDPVNLDSVPAEEVGMIHGAKSPGELFDHVALFTNRNFLSADTVPFFPDSKKYSVLLQSNGCLAYREPWIFKLGEGVESERSPIYKYQNYSTKEIEYLRSLGALEVDRLVVSTSEDNGYSKAVIGGKEVRLCHRTWLSFAGWAEPADHQRITYPCIEDQASVLVPLAVAANAKLLDLFVPKLEVIIHEIDYNTKKLRGEVKHTPHGAFPAPLLYCDDGPRCAVTVEDGKLQELDPKKVAVKDGVITAQLDDVKFKSGQKIVLEMDVAGFTVPSRPFGEEAWVLIDGKVIFRPGQADTFTFKGDVKGTTAVVSGAMKSERESYESFTCEYTWSDVPLRLRPMICFGHKAYKGEIVPGEMFEVPLAIRLVERGPGKRDDNARFEMKAKLVHYLDKASPQPDPPVMTVGQSAELGIYPNYINNQNQKSDAKTGTFKAPSMPDPEAEWRDFGVKIIINHDYCGEVVVIYRYAYDPTGSSVSPFQGRFDTTP